MQAGYIEKIEAGKKGVMVSLKIINFLTCEINRLYYS
jgi:hypothetical protein